MQPVTTLMALHGSRGLPGAVSEPVPLQDPSTSSPSTAATATWWTTCTATSTPSCSTAPTSATSPAPSSTATLCPAGSRCPGTWREVGGPRSTCWLPACLVQEAGESRVNLGLVHPRRHDSHTDDRGGICCHLLAVLSVLGPVLNTAGGTPPSFLWSPGLTAPPTPRWSSGALCTPASQGPEVNLAPSFFFSKNNTFVLLLVTKAICSYCRDKSNVRNA